MKFLPLKYLIVVIGLFLSIGGITWVLQAFTHPLLALLFLVVIALLAGRIANKIILKAVDK